MAVFGKRKTGAGTAVLDAPEDNYASDIDAAWPMPEPAPAGMLQRGRVADTLGEEPEEVYKPRREMGKRRIRIGIPRSTSGRIIGAASGLLLMGVVVGAVLGLRARLLHDERFVVSTSSEIQIGGNDHLTRAQVLSVFGSDLERNIFKVPLAERRADLERLPWVQHATVMRLLPNHLRVAITERVPVAFVRQGTQIGLVDATGVILDMPEQAAGDPHYSFPVLTGLNADDSASTRAAKMDIYRKFMQDLDTGAGSEKPSRSLSEVDVANPEDVKVLIPSGSTDLLVHFGDENFLDRYKLFQQNLPAWKLQYPKLASVDTRYEHQFVLEMQAGTPVPLNGGDAPAPAAGADATPVADAAKTPAKPVAKAESKPVAKQVPKKAAVAKNDAAKQKIAAQLAAARKTPTSN